METLGDDTTDTDGPPNQKEGQEDTSGTVAEVAAFSKGDRVEMVDGTFEIEKVSVTIRDQDKDDRSCKRNLCIKAGTQFDIIAFDEPSQTVRMHLRELTLSDIAFSNPNEGEVLTSVKRVAYVALPTSVVKPVQPVEASTEKKGDLEADQPSKKRGLEDDMAGQQDLIKDHGFGAGWAAPMKPVAHTKKSKPMSQTVLTGFGKSGDK